MKIGVTCLGCRSNHFDTVAITAQLRERGAAVVPFSDPADCYLINTCTVTGKADFQSRQLVRRARKRNPEARIAAVGCYPQRDPEALARLTDADYIFGNREKRDIAGVLCGEGGIPSSRQVRVGSIETETEVVNFGAWADTGRNRVELKIQEGCDRQCSYCIIPSTRGRPRSVPPERVRTAVETLEEMGYREIVLTGTHLGEYGREFRLDFSSWLRRFLGLTRSARIRLSSLEPWHTESEFVELFQSSERICSHLHLSAQSFSDGVLREMNRPYLGARVAQVIRSVVEARPETAVGIDIIAGFPGEDHEAFRETCSTVSALPIAYLHVFPFSPRPGTVAAGLPRCAPEREISGRVEILQELGRKKREEFFARFIGKWLEVVVEKEGFGRNGKTARNSGMVRGTSANFIPVVFPRKGEASGDVVRVKPEQVCGERRPYLFGRSEH